MQEILSHSVRRKPAATMVVGGGVGGMRAALDLADAGLKVYLIEQTPCLGGRVAQLGYMFPQHDCVLCRGTPDHGYGCTRPSISPAYIQHNQHPNIEVLTNTRLVDTVGHAGDFAVSLRQEPRYVDVSRCINCGYCTEACPVEMPDDYQQGMITRKAVHKVSSRAAPDTYVIDRGPYCDGCDKCAEICPTNAINLNEQPRLLTLHVSAIILALGFKMYDPSGLEELGYRRFDNVLHAMEYERLASRSGPTEGVVLRPSDKKRPRSIAWLQCVGSRDKVNTYCSSICCMYATKEAILAKERLGEDVECTVFFMDERAFNKQYSKYFAEARETHGIRYIHCRVSAIREDANTQNLILNYAQPNGQLRQEQFETVVLAAGLEPPDSAQQLAKMLDIELNQYGFCETDKFAPLQTSRPGVFVCGAFASPKEIAETIIDASGAAAEVMRLLNDSLSTHRYTREWPFMAREGPPLPASANGFAPPDRIPLPPPLNAAQLPPPERDVLGEPVRVGVFTCECGGTISEHIDLQELTHQTQAWPGVAYAEKLAVACTPEMQKHIQHRIQDEGLNRVVIAGCSNRTHDSLFQRTVRQAGLNPYLSELVNLREQCMRVHQTQPALANRKAKELVRIAVGRVKAAQPVHKIKFACQPRALVIGGGVAGMTAALAIADSGYDVHLVERSEMLGGNLLNVHYVAEGFSPQRLRRDMVNRVRAHQLVMPHFRTEVIQHTGHAGNFHSVLRTCDESGRTVDIIEIEHGATIVATGAQEAHNHPSLELPNVITQQELEEKIVHEPETIAALKNVVMIQCVRPKGVADYCSRVCCTNMLKNAIRIKLFNPGCQVTVLFKNMVTYGFREKFYTEARRQGIIFIRYTDECPPNIMAEDNKLWVKAYDQSLDRWLVLPADMVPLSMSIVPPEGTADLSQTLRVPLSSDGFYKQAQLKLRPMDFTREGVFLAGMAHYPKFIEESISHALAAAARALTLLSQKSLHMGGVVAVVDPDKCVGCLTCTRTCPFQIPQVLQQNGQTGVGGLGGAAHIDPAQCQGCGTCTGECPANAIQLVNYTDDQIMLPEIGGLGSWLVNN